MLMTSTSSFKEFVRMITVDKKPVTDIQLANVKASDYPDFCDAYIISASVFDNGWRDASEDEIDKLNEQNDLVNELALDSWF